jgi:4-carboxymuconolactone decarboxylase
MPDAGRPGRQEGMHMERTDRDGTDDRRARGAATYRAVYGEDAVVIPPGASDFFDLMIDHLFAEVWSRPALDIPTRRLLVMGVLAAQHRFDVLQLQFRRALDAAELTVEQVREVVIQLVPYVGYPSSGDLFRIGETAVAEHLAASGAAS